MRFLHGVFQPSEAISPSPSTNTIKTKPIVTSEAPIQSTRLTSSDEGTSASNEIRPETPMRAEVAAAI